MTGPEQHDSFDPKHEAPLTSPSTPLPGPEQHAATLREMLPSTDGHEPNCPCSVGRAHAALDELVALAGRADELEEKYRKAVVHWEAEGLQRRHHQKRAEAAEARADELQREREEREQFEDDVQAEAQETGQLALALDRLKLMGLANMVSPLGREAEQARRDALDYQHAYTDANEQLEQAREKLQRLASDEPLVAPRPLRSATYGFSQELRARREYARAALAGVQADNKDSGDVGGAPLARDSEANPFAWFGGADNKDSA